MRSTALSFALVAAVCLVSFSSPASAEWYRACIGPICQSLLGRLQLLVRLRDEQERRRATNLHGVHAARTDYRRFDTVTVASYGRNRCGYLVYDVFCYYR